MSYEDYETVPSAAEQATQAPEEEPDGEGQGEGEGDSGSDRAPGFAERMEKVREQAMQEADAAEAEPETEAAPLAQMDPRKRECPICHGYGRLMTGSRIEPFDECECWHCLGKGYEESIRVAGALSSVEPMAPSTPADNPDVWAWPSDSLSR